jgi:hypothetical protein
MGLFGTLVTHSTAKGLTADLPPYAGKVRRGSGRFNGWGAEQPAPPRRSPHLIAYALMWPPGNPGRVQYPLVAAVNVCTFWPTLLAGDSADGLYSPPRRGDSNRACWASQESLPPDIWGHPQGPE